MKVRDFIKQYMGRQVRFTRKLVKRAKPDERGFTIRYWHNEPLVKGVDFEVGWVTGLRWLPQGYIVIGCAEEGNYFQPKGKSTPAALVVTYPTRNPVRVPLDAIEVLEEPVEVSILNEDQRKWLSKDSEDWPRDKNGRWTDGS